MHELYCCLCAASIFGPIALYTSFETSPMHPASRPRIDLYLEIDTNSSAIVESEGSENIEF